MGGISSRIVAVGLHHLFHRGPWAGLVMLPPEGDAAFSQVWRPAASLAALADGSPREDAARAARPQPHAGHAPLH